MVCGPVQTAKRALVSLICALAQVYKVNVQCKRDSADELVLKDFRRLALKAHPDRGGQSAHQQQLNDARVAWEAAKKQGRGPAQGVVVLASPSTAPRRKAFRVNATAVLLTYQGLSGYDQWLRMNGFVVVQLQAWTVKHWCATLETGVGEVAFHAHVMLQFVGEVDRSARAFSFEGIAPNVRPCDLCGEGLSRRKLQSSIDRGFFYVWADKIGTARTPEGKVCVAGNYFPCWVE